MLNKGKKPIYYFYNFYGNYHDRRQLDLQYISIQECYHTIQDHIDYLMHKTGLIKSEIITINYT